MPETLTQSTLAKEIRARRPQDVGDLESHVSIVVVNRNGAHHLERLLASLRDQTAYPSFDLIVVDNGSSDRSMSLLEADSWPFEIRVVRNPVNATFSKANNQGIALADSADHILLLNNDIEPINRSWLGVLVRALGEEPSSVAVGALLIYPERQFPEGQSPSHPDLTVQHAGVSFDWFHGRLRAQNTGSGGNALRRDRTASRYRPAATAACLLVRSSALKAIGGFTEGFIYGSEDWDLCLRLREHGDISVIGAAALFHHEYGTQSEIQPIIVELNRRHNRHLFIEHWGPRLSRDLRLDRIRHRNFWNPDRSGRLALVSPTTEPEEPLVEFGRSLEKRGWEVEFHTDGPILQGSSRTQLDVVITTSPEVNWAHYAYHALRVGWVQDRVSRWEKAEELDKYTAFLISNPTEAAYLETLTGRKPMIFLPAWEYREKRPVHDAVHSSDVLVVGNRSGAGRDLAKKVDLQADERLIVAGAGWEGEPRMGRYWSSSIEGDELEALMANAGIVLHTASTSSAWQRAPRILQTLDVGGMPVTDNFEIAQWLFDGELPVISSRSDFRDALEGLVHEASNRTQLRDRLRDIALERHTFDRRAAEFDDLLDKEVSRPLVALNISAPNKEVAESWGDTHFARQFGNALRRMGFNTRIHLLPQWEQPEFQDADIVLHLRGLDPYVPKPGALNVMWIVSHPEDVTPEECDRYDLVLVASEVFAKELRERVQVPVRVMLQATDLHTFHPQEPVPELHTEVLFVGNARWPPRIAPRWSMEIGVPLVIYGANWDNFPESELVRDKYFANEELGKLYESAEIVLNDHWPDMKARGFISNRLFDVLAAGGFVISDYVDGIESTFADAIPTYRTKSELAELIEYFRSNPEERVSRSIRGMRHVHEHHTFDSRAREFLEILGETVMSLPLDVSGELKVDIGSMLSALDDR